MEKVKRIVVKRTGEEYHAFIEGHPEIWEVGKDYRLAVGKLVEGHPEQFGIVVMMESEREKAIGILRNSLYGTLIPKTHIGSSLKRV